MAIGDGTGAGALEFYAWAGERGEIAKASASNFSVATKRILSVEDDALDWGLDRIEAELDGLYDRFHTLNRTNFTEDSMATYRSRARSGLGMYRAWLAKDPNWKGKPAKKAPSAKVQAVLDKFGSTSVASLPDYDVASTGAPFDPPLSVGAPRLLHHDLLIRVGQAGKVSLPPDVTRTEFRRAMGYLESLLFDRDDEAGGSGA